MCDSLTPMSTPKPNRAIDRHEDAIVRVLDICDADPEAISYDQALACVAATEGLTTERLDSLVRTWCAIAGIEVPS
jgi:hypothetical protein